MQLSHHFVALPSVTPTAKPAVSPVARHITGTDRGRGVPPRVASDGKDLTTDRFRKLLDEEGFQVLRRDRRRQPDGPGLDRVRQPGHRPATTRGVVWPAASRS